MYAARLATTTTPTMPRVMKQAMKMNRPSNWSPVSPLSMQTG
jgi:hypothetical protein